MVDSLTVEAKLTPKYTDFWLKKMLVQKNVSTPGTLYHTIHYDTVFRYNTTRKWIPKI